MTAAPAHRDCPPASGFSLSDLLVVLAVLSLVATVALAAQARSAQQARLARCTANLQQVNRAVLQFAGDHGQTLPRMEGSPAPGGWWWYKEMVKPYTGEAANVRGLKSFFACPDDRGYGDGPGKSQPFWSNGKYDFTSYVFNGVNLPGMPNVAGRDLASIQAPARTLLTMEWTAHAPLSWHRSRTGRLNAPFYNDAESVVGFVDGHVALIKIYYDGLNAAYTRDPVPGYDYKYSGD